MKDEDMPDYLTRERYALMADEDRIMVGELVGLQKKNTEVAQRIVRQGVPIDPMDLLYLRMDTILGQLYPDVVERTKFELHFEGRGQEYLANLEAAVTKAKLMLPGNGQ